MSYRTLAAQQLSINEFLADNDTTVVDQDGEHDDWIELYNYGEITISLGGYHLSDRSDNFTQWTFPDVAIESHSFLVIWADNDTSQIGLHAGFKLSASGESIYLSDTEGRIIDQITYGMQTSDISFGRFPDGSGEFKRMNPTFAAPNDGDDPIVLDPGETIYGDTKLHSINLHFYVSDWEDSLKYCFEELGKEYFPARVTFDDSLVFDSVGVRYKGNSSYVQSRNTPKKPFKIKFDKYRDEQTLLGIHVINLHNCINDPSFMRETLAYHIARSLMPAPRTAYANLYVDGVLIGFYNMAEQVDKIFLASHFYSNEGNLYKAGNDGANLGYVGNDQEDYESDYSLKTNEDENDWSRFIRMIDRLNNTSDAVFTDTMQYYLDLDNCAKLLAYNMVLSNFDSYTGSGRNFYFYDDRFAGQFKMIPWDLNESFGVFTNSWDVITQDITGISNISIRPLNDRIMGNDSLQQLYLGYISQLITGAASYDSLAAIADSLELVIDDYVEADTNKLYDYQDFLDNIESDVTIGLGKVIPGIKSFSRGRNSNLTRQLARLRVYPGDTDNNGIVEALDILPIGVYFLNTGDSRYSISMTWLGHQSYPWTDDAATYADANGDGVIDENDIIAIGVNWGNHHAAISTSYTLDPRNLANANLSTENFEFIYNNLSGNSEPIVEMKTLLAEILDDKQEIPTEYSLGQNYPNPFNQETVISFTLDTKRSVSLTVYDITGQIVARPLAATSYDPGDHMIIINAANWPSGVYFYRLETNKGALIRKMTIVK